MIWQTKIQRCIYQSVNASVYDNLIYRWLTFNGAAIQTLINKHRPCHGILRYLQALTLAARLNPGTSCLLGLGGGSAAHILATYFNNHSTLVAVELSDEVIMLAKKFFMVGMLPYLTIINADAYTYLQQCDEQLFKHLMIDLFTNEAFPYINDYHDFFKQCYRVLSPGGMCAINIANAHEQQSLLTQLKYQFNGVVVIIPVKKCANVVAIAAKNTNVTALKQYFSAHKEVTSFCWQPLWGYIATL